MIETKAVRTADSVISIPAEQSAEPVPVSKNAANAVPVTRRAACHATRRSKWSAGVRRIPYMRQFPNRRISLTPARGAPSGGTGHRCTRGAIAGAAATGNSFQFLRTSLELRGTGYVTIHAERGKSEPAAFIDRDCGCDDSLPDFKTRATLGSLAEPPALPGLPRTVQPIPFQRNEVRSVGGHSFQGLVADYLCYGLH